MESTIVDNSSSIDIQIRDGIEHAISLALFYMPEIEGLDTYAYKKAEDFMNPVIASIWSELPDEVREKMVKEVVSKSIH